VLVVASELMAARVEVAGTITVSGSDIYALSLMAFLGPAPAAVVSMAVELVVSRFSREMTLLKTVDNLAGLATYGVVGGAIFAARTAFGGCRPGDLEFFALTFAANYGANLACFLAIASHWRAAKGEPVRDALATYVRFTPWHAISGLLGALGIDAYARSGLPGLLARRFTSVMSPRASSTTTIAPVRSRNSCVRSRSLRRSTSTRVSRASSHSAMRNTTNSASEVIGYADGELLGRPAGRLLPGDDFERLLAGDAGDRVVRFESTVRTRTGAARRRSPGTRARCARPAR
jgi:hypothetical protein